MTAFRPATAGLAARIFDGATLKAVVSAVITVTAWHYTDAGEIRAQHQKNVDQDHRMDLQRESINGKVDKETYDRDIRSMIETQHLIQTSIEGIHHTLEERH